VDIPDQHHNEVPDIPAHVARSARRTGPTLLLAFLTLTAFMIVPTPVSAQIYDLEVWINAPYNAYFCVELWVDGNEVNGCVPVQGGSYNYRHFVYGPGIHNVQIRHDGATCVSRGFNPDVMYGVQMNSMMWIDVPAGCGGGGGDDGGVDDGGGDDGGGDDGGGGGVVPVDAKPTITVGNLNNGQVLQDDYTVTGTAADDKGVDYVQYRVNGGGWQDATGLNNWHMDIDAGVLGYGTHTIDFRATDTGGQASAVTSREIIIDEEPRIIIHDPKTDDVFYGIPEVSISIVDDGEHVTSIEYRINNGGYEEVPNPTLSKTFFADTMEELPPGHYDITIKVSDGRWEDTATVNVEIKANTPPTPDVYFPASNKLTLETIEFDAAGSVDDEDALNQLQFLFDYGDGTQTSWSSAYLAEHEYARPGTYIVKVRVKDTKGSIGTSEETLVIGNRPPVMPIFPDIDTKTGIIPVTGENITDPDGAISDIQWSFGSDPLYGMEQTLLFSNLGSTKVTVTAYDDTGASSIAEFFVNVTNTAPRANPGDDMLGRAGEQVTFDGTA